MRVSACVTQYLQLAELLSVSASRSSSLKAVLTSFFKQALSRCINGLREVDTLLPGQSKVRILERLIVKLQLLKMTFSFAISFLRVTFVSEVILLPLVTHSNTFFIFG